MANHAAVEKRRTSPRVHNPAVKASLGSIDLALGTRTSPYQQRASKQSALLKLPGELTKRVGGRPRALSRGQIQTAALERSINGCRSGTRVQGWQAIHAVLTVPGTDAGGVPIEYDPQPASAE